MEIGDNTNEESSFLRCNKKSLSLSIANVRLRDVNNQSQIHKVGSTECQYLVQADRYNCDVSQYRVESLNF